MNDDLISSKEAAKLTHYTPQRICQLAAARKIKAIKRGRIWLFKAEDLETLFQSNIDVSLT